jgi:oligopeptide/dipeptide ABC transporter ATP-binding protein
MQLIPNPPGKIIDGRIVFHSRELRPLDAEEMRKIRGKEIAMIFQEPMTCLNPVLTIGRQLTETMEEHLNLSLPEAETRSVELLKMVGIPDPRRRLGQYPHQFSGGMRQRVMIAMALACNPQIVIADEPTTALDVMIQAQILELLAHLRDKLGLAVLFVTHDLGIVAEVCDSVLVMYGGMVAEYADVDTVFNRPRHPYTQELLKAFPNLSNLQERLISIPGYPPRLNALPPGCLFAPRCPVVFERCHTAPPPLYRLNPVKAHYAGCYLVEKGG